MLEPGSVHWLLPASTVALFLLLWLLSRLVLTRLERLLARAASPLYARLIAAGRLPVALLILTTGLACLRLELVALDQIDTAVAQALLTGLKALVILTLVLFVDALARVSITRFIEQREALKSSGSIARILVRAVVLGLGLLVLLGTLGIAVTPLVASLGITSLAVALALQPTLENFFSGVQIVMDRPVRAGDFVELESGEQGFVETIGWRSTHIRMLQNNIVIMPNSKLAQSKLINYYLPQKELSVPVAFRVRYDADLERIEQITLDVARRVLRDHEWGVTEYNTFVLFTDFDDFAIRVTCMLRAKEYFNRFWVKSAFIKALHARFRQEGIVMPYPITALDLDQQAGGARAAPAQASPPRAAGSG
ncbi:MAG: mechanosensitive ion channel protein MscS [Salinisphaeraceae bacterium]|nr:mechanosensitive ion channel protein MscS [Salinisphaeraceae bacterium]